jgi:hypothetical protein
VTESLPLPPRPVGFRLLTVTELLGPEQVSCPTPADSRGRRGRAGRAVLIIMPGIRVCALLAPARRAESARPGGRGTVSVQLDSELRLTEFSEVSARACSSRG